MKRSLSESQALTRAAPTASSDGMALDNLAGYRVSVCAESGQTLSGSGNLRAYLYHGDVGLWMRNPALDLAVSVSGARCQVFPDIEPAAREIGENHRVLYAADTVGVSGGTTVTVRIDGATR